jgi:phosphate transport system substrate-binding protein
MKSKLALAVLAFVSLVSGSLAEPVRILSSPVLGQALISMLPALRELNIELKVYQEISSGIAIDALRTDRAEVIITVRPLTGEDRAVVPSKLLQEYPLGLHAVAVVVSPDVWAAGVRSLTKAQLRGIYQLDIKNWKEVGGPDLPITFYSYDKGKGVWEQFATWIYGDLRKAPLPKSEILVNGMDVRNTLAFNKGVIALAAPVWADGKDAFALALEDEKGTPVEPTLPMLSNRRYPMVRQLFVIFGDKPVGPRKRFLEYLLSPAGQDILRKNDLIPTTDLTEE